MKFSSLLTFLVFHTLLGLTGLGANPARFTKDAMLRDIAHKVISSGYEELDLKCRDLTNAIGKLVETPGRTTREAAQQAWGAAAQCAGRMQCFQKGPILDRDYVSTFYYWQVLPLRLEAVIQSQQLISQSFFDEMGATTKGIFALEFLLFETMPNAAALEATGKDGERRRVFVQALVMDVQMKAGELATDWKSAGQDSPTAKFVNNGQESVNVLVNQLAQLTELVGERQLNFVLLLPSPISMQLDRIEGSRSGRSLTGILAKLEGARKLYRGADGLGLDDAVGQVNASLAKRLDEQFDAAIASVRSIAAPLEQAVGHNRSSVQKAYEEMHALEVLLKVDLASALGVTLTFSSADGD